MGLLDRLFKRSDAEDNGANKLREIWKMEDASSFVIALNDYIAEKCRYGEDMQALSPPERVFYIVQSLEMEVNNGGFDQFFVNSSGDFANELAQAFTEIGAVKTAEICRRAVAVFGGRVPDNRAERQDILEENEEFEAILEECDDAFLAYEEDLEALNHAYVLQHGEAFT